jgi:hypothetical protein
MDWARVKAALASAHLPEKGKILESGWRIQFHLSSSATCMVTYGYHSLSSMNDYST